MCLSVQYIHRSVTCASRFFLFCSAGALDYAAMHVAIVFVPRVPFYRRVSTRCTERVFPPVVVVRLSHAVPWPATGKISDHNRLDAVHTPSRGVRSMEVSPICHSPHCSTAAKSNISSLESRRNVSYLKPRFTFFPLPASCHIFASSLTVPYARASARQ